MVSLLLKARSDFFEKVLSLIGNIKSKKHETGWNCNTWRHCETICMKVVSLIASYQRTTRMEKNHLLEFSARIRIVCEEVNDAVLHNWSIIDGEVAFRALGLSR